MTRRQKKLCTLGQCVMIILGGVFVTAVVVLVSAVATEISYDVYAKIACGYEDCLHVEHW